jgi:ribosomal protein S8
MIHILNDSPYVGKFERVAEKMNHILTDEIRKTILKIKWELARNKRKAMGIEICQAVIKDNILKYSEFLEWQEVNKNDGILKWEPEIPIH